MSDMKVESALSSAGVDKSEFDQEAQKAEQSPEIQAQIDKLSKDGLTEKEQTEIGGMVADKALEAMDAPNKDDLTADEKMALAEYCGKCLDGQANEAADEAVTEPAAT